MLRYVKYTKMAKTTKTKSPSASEKAVKKKTAPKKSPKTKTKKALKKSPKCKDTGKLKKPTETGRVCKKKPGPKKSPKTTKKVVKKSPKTTTKKLTGRGGTKETTFYCVKCRAKVECQDICLLVKTSNDRTVHMLRGKHPACEVQCHKIVSKDSVPDLKKKYRICK